MAFVLRKLISRMLFPVPLVFLLAGLAVILWCVGRRRDRPGLRSSAGLKRAAAAAAGSALVIFWLLSTAPVADAFLLSLERRYDPLESLPSEVDLIVVLGAGHSEWERFPGSAQLGDAGLARTTEAVRLLRTSDRVLTTVFTGYAGQGAIPTAEVARRTAVSLGMPSEATDVLTTPRDTREEARAVREYLYSERGQDSSTGRIVLITSASHMPRAVREFQGAGLTVLPAPAGYRAFRGAYSAWSYLPGAVALQRSERAWYEYLGLLWVRLSKP